MDNREPSRIRAQGTPVTKAATGIDRIDACRRIVANQQYAKIDGVMVDLFTASAIVKVYDAVNETNRAKLAAMPLPRMASICFSLLK